MHSIAETAVIWKWTMTTIMTGRVAVRIKAAGCHRAQKPVPPFSGKKLTVTTRVLAKITNSFIGRKEEAGGILGASKSLDIVDSFALIPAEKAGKYYYIPDIEAANRQIHQWAKEEICFCGFIHSHITDKKELSDGDYQLMQDLPKEEKITSECEKRIREDYLGAIQDIVTAIKSEGCVQVSISQSKAKGAHAVLLVGINKETEDFVDAQVWDPNQVEIKSLYMYKDKGDAKDSIRISTEVYGDKFDQLYRWFSGIDNIDTRNYFGMDDHQEAKDYDKARIKIRSNMSLSFSSGDVSLNIVNGKIESDRNVSGPYYSEIDDENGEGEIKFSIEKQYLGNEAICTASGKNSINELTIINDGWSVSIVSDKPIQISMDNTEQSVKIQSEEKGLLSAWLTQNTPSANSAWYGTAVDVNDAKELILTPTSEGVKVNSDNMQDARVTVNGDGTFASKAINTTKNEILVQEDADATIGDCIKIQGTYTIRASVGLHGTISPAGYVAVDAGGTQTFTFTPDEGYTVEHVKVNGKNKGEITDYTFKKVKKDQEIEVTFREKTEQDSEPKEKSGYGPILDWILSIIEWIKHWFQA